MSKTLSTRQVANRWGVKPAKVLSLIRAGELEAFDVSLKLGGRPRFRITPEAVAKFEKGRTVQAAPKQPRRYTKPKRADFVEYIK